MNTNLMFSSKNEKFSTPQYIYNNLNREFHFTLDPCCEEFTKKVPDNYYTAETNGLDKSWEGETVFMNPPYGRKETGVWIRKAYEESLKPDTTVVALIPSRTDTKFWHDCCMNASEIRFIKGRLKFGEATEAAPFPSCVVVFNGDNSCKVSTMENVKGTPLIDIQSNLVSISS